MDIHEAVQKAVLEALTQLAEEGYDPDKFYSPLVDVVAGLLLRAGDVEGALSAIERIEHRIAEHKAGVRLQFKERDELFEVEGQGEWTDKDYGAVVDAFRVAMRQMGEDSFPVDLVLVVMTDVLALQACRMGGEKFARVLIDRMGYRIFDWKAGNFDEKAGA